MNLENSSSERCKHAVEQALQKSASSERGYEDAASYNETLKSTFHRTLHDVAAAVPPGARILEVGAFTGVVSIALKQLGYSVCASDIPFVINDEATKELFKKEGIDVLPHELSQVPFLSADDSFDAIVFCEVLEHLNFNPLPLIGEFQRILRPGGAVYCATPNLASIKNRTFLFRGKAFYNPIEHLEWNLTPETGMSVGLHWREYTKAEMCQLFESRGLEMESHYYCNYAASNPGMNPRRQLVSLMYRLFPAFMHGQAAVFRKSAS
ncbi:class I SAM-dependent methyltransferase [Rhodopirellula sallentina]|uniref:Methyltransferase type 11 n=1 Tax=Rhodopirellula sallentina SM41 TaxID=1263870 RepID=M5U336_9BACT|nr:class I SAM-dependent methyltransferase [Rhodopirellula sallentina]EMI52261.1 methyltransferase type 11 [Rhodopirellula sallentina SM41]